MHKKSIIKPPFFEIGPKNYLFGDQILELALAADKASEKYNVDIIFTTPYVDIRTVSEKTKKIHVFAPHMDCVSAGRGLANILPESLKAAGAKGVMLNHAEKPLEYSRLADTIKRAKELELISIVCANSIDEAKAVALLNPEIIVAEPTELIGTGKSVDVAYVRDACNAVRSINPEIYVLIAAGINDGKDVYRSFGLFSNARVISTQESLKLLSDVRLGVCMGIIKDVDIETLNKIMLLIQPANLQKALNKTLSANERDIKRAELIRSTLAGKLTGS
jgi:triosephosphate isomerase